MHHDRKPVAVAISHACGDRRAKRRSISASIRRPSERPDKVATTRHLKSPAATAKLIRLAGKKRTPLILSLSLRKSSIAPRI
jgi:hypothetical protein